MWFMPLGLFVASAVEITLGITLITKAIQQGRALPDPRQTITMILEELGEATTAEIIEKASQRSQDCKDRIPGTLVDLEENNKIKKRISREKKALVWTLVF